MEKLSKEEQIGILESVLDDISKLKIILGLCGLVKKKLSSKGLEVDVCSSSGISVYIDGFNIANAKRLSKIYNFEYPKGSYYRYWWSGRFDIDKTKEEWYAPRIAFIKALITELKRD
jgi:hypothetical protein